MKKIITIICLLCLLNITAMAQAGLYVTGGTTVTASAGANVTLHNTNFMNDGSYSHETGTLKISAGNFSGNGATIVDYLTAEGCTFNSLVTVNKTATLLSGNINANNNLFIAAGGNVVIEGVVTNNIQGLVTKATQNTGGCPSYSSTLSINASGSVVNYQWQSSTDNTNWSNVNGATNATLNATVNAAKYYRCHLTTTNSSFDEFTESVLLGFSGGATSSNTNLSITSAQLPYSWNGLTFTAAGTQTAHLTNAAGCDSAATLNLTVTASCVPTTSSTTHTTCDSYLWNGTNYTTSGDYTVHFTNSCGSDSAASLHLTINSATTSTTNLSVCSNQLPFSWNGLTFTAAGTQTAHLTNSVGCDSAATLNLTVATTSVPTIVVSTASNSVCAGSVVTFIATPINGGTTPIYQWKKNGVNVGTNSNTYSLTTLADNDSVWCVLTSNSACATNTTAISNKIKMTVRPNPSIGTSFTVPANGIICTIGGTVGVLNSNTLNGGVWSSSNTSVATVTTASNQANGAVTGVSNGTSILTYTKTSSNGCSSTASTIVTVAAMAAPTAITGASSLCVGATTTLTSSPLGGVWSSLTNRAIINASTGVVTGSNIGTASIKYTVTNANGCSNSVTAAMPINAVTVAPSIFYAVGSINPQMGASAGNYCTNRNFTVAGSPVGGVWSSTGALVVNATTGAASTNATTGAASLTYTVTSSGCVNSRTITGSVVGCASRGINGQQSSVDSRPLAVDFTIYPNPAKSFISLNVETIVGKGQIIITDLYGKQVKTQALSLGINTLNIANLSKGFYLISTITTEGKTTKKLVVE